jgi:hypothetical protein
MLITFGSRLSPTTLTVLAVILLLILCSGSGFLPGLGLLYDLK